MQRYLFVFSFLIGVVGVFTACESDDKFRVITREAFILIKDSLNPTTLLSYDYITGKIETNAHTRYGISDAGLSDVSGKNDLLCLADKNKRTISIIEFKNKKGSRVGETDIEVSMISLGDFTPHAITAGESFLLAMDSSAQKIAFINLKKPNKEVHYRSLTSAPLFAHYTMGRFYLSTSKKSLQVWEEAAFAMREEVSVRENIYFISADDMTKTNGLLLFYRAGDSLFSARYNLLNGNITKNTFGNYFTLEYSPYRTISYGNEWLGQVKHLETKAILLIENNSSWVFVNGVKSANMDFFNSVLFVKNKDYLTIYKNLKDSSKNQRIPIMGNSIKSIFRTGYKG